MLMMRIIEKNVACNGDGDGDGDGDEDGGNWLVLYCCFRLERQ